jgi:hypothetical protein
MGHDRGGAKCHEAIAESRKNKGVNDVQVVGARSESDENSWRRMPIRSSETAPARMMPQGRPLPPNQAHPVPTYRVSGI